MGLQIGVAVITRGKSGVVRFIGPTDFAEGVWVGVELDSPDGKNDGSVQGVRYFTCRHQEEGQFGLFVRPALVKIVGKERDESHEITDRRVLSDNSSQNISPQNVLPETFPVHRSRMAPSPLPDNIPQLNTPKRTNILSEGPSSPSPARHSLQSPTRFTAKSSEFCEMQSPNRSSNQSPIRPNSRAPTLGPPSPRKQSATPVGLAGLAGLGLRSPSRKPSRSFSGAVLNNLMSPPVLRPVTRSFSGASNQGLEYSPALIAASPKSGSAMEPPSPLLYGSDISLQRQIETLKTKLKIMEKKRLEDREKLSLIQADNKKVVRLENIIKRLQLKLSPMHEEIQSLRQKLAQVESENSNLANDRDNNTLELTILDKEMAEEKSAALALELEEFKLKFEQLELECEVLREENALYAAENEYQGKADDGSVVRLQKRNDKLEDALLRLREYCTSQEASFQNKITSLEQEAHKARNIAGAYRHSQTRLEEAEKIVLDLRVQLDNALGAEDMIENLTEKNLELNEKCEELQNTIDELEILRDLNDELETNHSLREKQLLAEIAQLESVIGESKRRMTDYESRNEYLETAIIRFRELVTSLDRDLTTLKSTSGDTTTSQEAIEHAKALQDLNLKLASSSIESRSNALDLEIKKHDSQQAIKQLEIVKCYMSDDYHGIESSIQVYLKLFNIEFESRLIRAHIKEKIHDSPAVTVKSIVSLIELQMIAHKLTNYFAESSPDQFKSAAGHLYDIESIESSLASEIELLRKDEFRHDDFIKLLSTMVSRLQRIEDSCKLVRSAADVLSELDLLFSHFRFIINSLSLSLSGKAAQDFESASTVISRLLDGVKDKVDKVFSRDQVGALDGLKQSLLQWLSSIFSHVGDNETNDNDLILKQLDILKAIRLIDLTSRTVPRSPWVIKAEQLKALRGKHEVMSKELETLKLESHNLATALRLKDKAIEELEVRVNVLNAKVVKARDQDKIIAELKKSLATVSAQERILIEASNKLKTTVEQQERSLARYKRSTIVGFQDGDVVPLAAINSLNIASELNALRSTVKYLSQENASLKSRKFGLGQLAELEVRKPVVLSPVYNECQPLFASLQNYVKEFDVVSVKVPKTLWESRQKSNRVRLFLQKEKMARVGSYIDSIC